MSKERSPKRDKAFEIWKNSEGKIPLKDIAEQLGVSPSQIRNWKVKDNWDAKLSNDCATNQNAINDCTNDCATNQHKRRGPPQGSKNAAGHGAPKGNKNALGNRGGSGGPVGNKKAVTTGEFETIWFDCLTEQEQALCSAIDTDTLIQVEEDIRLITIRERRMMERIKKITDGLTEKERKVLQERIDQKRPIAVEHEVTGEKRIVIVRNPQMITTEITETEFRKIDDIMKIEESLTRVQEKKAKLLALKHDIEEARNKDGENGEEPVQIVDDIGSDDDEAD